jgi:hypothetical protein
MDGYEKHYLTAVMSKPAPAGIPDLLAEMQDYVPPDVPDEFSALKIEEVQAADRIREREELRPLEPETEPVTSALWHMSDELAKLRAAKIKN